MRYAIKSTLLDLNSSKLAIQKQLMKNLVGLLEPTSGQVLYDGRDFVNMSKKEKVLMRREMGMIFQSAALMICSVHGSLTVSG